ncbi:MAG: DUF4406 domain-containing protein, partial [Lachnospiraceae bacterium]
REEAKETRNVYRPLAYIVSPYAGDIPGNVAAARRYCRFAVDQGRIPVCSHLLYPQFLNDDDPKEHELGLFFGRILMDHCREVWIFTDGTLTPGMEAEYRRAKRHQQKIRYFTTDCQETDGPGTRGADGPV